MPRVKLDRMVDQDKVREPKWEPILPVKTYPDLDYLRKVPGTPFFVDVNTGIIYLDKAVLEMLI